MELPDVGVVAPGRNLNCAELFPANFSVVESTAVVLSYHPCGARFADSKSSLNSTVAADGTETVTVALTPGFVPDVAVMVAVPLATAVTSPLADTVATEALLVDHVMGAHPERSVPSLARGVGAI